jgi:hypothetical protein
MSEDDTFRNRTYRPMPESRPGELEEPELPLETGYRDMAADTERERETLEWVNALIGDGMK